jgi:hypothetical protein
MLARSAQVLWRHSARRHDALGGTRGSSHAHRNRGDCAQTFQSLTGLRIASSRWRGLDESIFFFRLIGHGRYKS